MDKEGYAGSYIGSVMKAVKSWLAFNDFQVGKIRIEGVDLTPTLDSSRKVVDRGGFEPPTIRVAYATFRVRGGYCSP